MAFHTFELSRVIDSGENYRKIKDLLYSTGCKAYRDKAEPVPTEVFEIGNGLCIYIREIKKNKYIYHKLYYRINPRRIMDDNDYVGLFDASESDEMLSRLDRLLSEIGVPTVNECSLNRIDFCCNALLDSPEEVDLYIKLLKRGRELKKYTVQKFYDKKAKRRIISENGITYKGNNDVNIVFYNKQREMKQQKLPADDIEYLNRIIRIEIQCRRQKVLRICKKYKIDNVREFLKRSDDIGIDIFKKYTGLFCGRGDFFKGKKIDKIIDKASFKNKTKSLMKELAGLSAKHSSLDTAVCELSKKYGAKKTEKVLRQFDKLKVSPVVIPRRCEYDRLPGTVRLAKLYYNRC